VKKKRLAGRFLLDTFVHDSFRAARKKKKKNGFCTPNPPLTQSVSADLS